ncbi:hypothetical protein [Kitasatospora sp. NPDC001132]
MAPYLARPHAARVPAVVVADAGPVALANRQQAVADLSADCWRGRWCREVRDDNDDGWREYDDAVPIVATTLELPAARGPLGRVWWRFGRAGRHSLIESLDNPNNRAAYDLRQAAREDEQHKAHQELMDSLVCIDCGDVPEEESTWEYGPKGQVEWSRRPGSRCWSCHEREQERREEEREAAAQARLEAARAANAALRPCWTCRGSIGGKEGSELEREKTASDASRRTNRRSVSQTSDTGWRRHHVHRYRRHQQAEPNSMVSTLVGAVDYGDSRSVASSHQMQLAALGTSVQRLSVRTIAPAAFSARSAARPGTTWPGVLQNPLVPHTGLGVCSREPALARALWSRHDGCWLYGGGIGPGNGPQTPAGGQSPEGRSWRAPRK